MYMRYIHYEVVELANILLVRTFQRTGNPSYDVVFST